MKVLETVCDIIQTGMDLKKDQIWIYNQKVDIPNDKRLYAVVSLKSETPIGNNIFFDPLTQKENIYTNLVSDVGIEIFSFDVLALNRRYEVLSAMRSTYSLQKQEENNCNISRRPISMFDSSFMSPTAKLYSFFYIYKITHVEKYTRSVDYYDDFSRADMSNKENIKVNL